MFWAGAEEQLKPWVDHAWDKVEQVAPFLDRTDPATWPNPAQKWESNQKGDGTRVPELFCSFLLVFHWLLMDEISIQN